MTFELDASMCVRKRITIYKTCLYINFKSPANPKTNKQPFVAYKDKTENVFQFLNQPKVSKALLRLLLYFFYFESWS